MFLDALSCTCKNVYDHHDDDLYLAINVGVKVK